MSLDYLLRDTAAVEAIALVTRRAGSKFLNLEAERKQPLVELAIQIADLFGLSATSSCTRSSPCRDRNTVVMSGVYAGR